uniref:Ground-like domain-containing protein n=2 Tax=Acrobeloides nanus TaxID=290746 RepID=A0A914C8H5_9BILA
MQNEFVNYYISQLYDPQFLNNGSLVNINYGVDGGNFGIKWPNFYDNDNRTLKEYFEDGDILRKKQKRGEFNDLYNILLSIFLNDVYFCYGHEFLNCYDGGFPQNNIVFMGSPSKTAPPHTTLDLTFLQDTTYNGTNEINVINHYFHGPTGRNKFIVILMENDTYEQWNKTNLQTWLDAGLNVLQYNNDDGQLLYDLREHGGSCGCPPAPPPCQPNLPQISVPTPCLPPLPQVNIPTPCLPELPKVDIPTLLCIPPPCPFTLPSLPPPMLPSICLPTIPSCGCRRNKRDTAARLPIIQGNTTKDSLCSNNAIREIILKNIKPDPTKSKAAIHSEMKSKLGGNYVVTCSNELVSFIADASNYCVDGNDTQTCYVFEI